MPLVLDETLTIQSYLESLFEKHLENSSGIYQISGISDIASQNYTELWKHATGISGSSIVDGTINNLYGVTTGINARFIIDTYNNINNFGSSIRGRRFRGTPEFPSGVQKNDTIVHIAAEGHNTSSLINLPAATLIFASAEDWTTGSNGTYFRLRLTKSGENFLTDRLWIKDNGNAGFSNTDPQHKIDVSGAGNFTEGLLINNNNIGTGNFQVLSGFLSNNIESTGSYLLSQLGAGTVASINTKIGVVTIQGGGNISVTEDLVLPIITISGATGSLVSNFYPLNSNPSNYLTSLNGTGTLTGQFYSINNPNNYITGINTGNFITNSQTGNFLGRTETGNFYSIQNVNNYVSSGATGLLTNTLIPRAESGQFYSIVNINSYSTSGNLASTGQTLDNKISTLSGQVVFSSQTGGFYRDNINNYSTSGNLTSTGVILTNQISSLSGDVLVIRSNLTQTGISLINSDNIIISNLTNTGINLLNRINLVSGDLQSTGSNLFSRNQLLSGNLISTGQNLDSKIIVLSGQVTFSNQTGGFYPSYNPAAFSTSGNLYSTGLFIQNQLTSLSGDFTLDKNNLTTSGANLLNWITNASGKINSVSGNLTTTGITLLNQINSLSGYVISTGAFLNNRIDNLPPGSSAGGVTGITISGGNSLTGLFSIVQGTNITLTQLGNTGFMIAGPTAGGEANTASNIAGGSGLFSQKVGVDLQFKSLKAGDNISITGDSNSLTIKCAQPFPLQFNTNATTWTNMPLANTFFAGSIGYTQYIDLTNFTGVQLCITKAGTAGGATSMLQLKYNGNFQAAVGSYLNLDSNATKSRINVQNVHINSGYQPIVAAARSGVFVTLMGSGGDGVLDPIFGNIIAYFR